MKIGSIDIVDLRLGASQVSAWLGGEMVWGGSGPTPPTPSMTHVEYIESTGLEYIDTGIDGRSVYDLEFKFMAPADVAHTKWANLLAGVSDNFTLGFWDTSNTEYFLRWRTVEKMHAQSVAAGNQYTFAISGPTATFAGTSYNLGSTSAVATQAGNIMICTNTSLSRIAKIRIYGLKLYDSSSNLLRDLVPVRVEGVGYMYDNVSGELFGNNGTGAFIIGPDKVELNCLCFTSQEANCTVRLDKIGSPNAISLEYSTDGSTWSDYDTTKSTGDVLTLTNVGDKVYMRAKTENDHIAASSANSNRYNFVTTGRIAASGNIQTLLKADGTRTDLGTSGEGFRRLFQDTTITEAPELPATELRPHCYEDMFKFCYSLTAAPTVLPAVTTTTDSYRGMFSGCSALTDSPIISAVVSPNWTNMGWMFENCSSLSSICVCLSAWNSGNNYWVSNVKSSGIFTCPSTLPDQRGNRFIPNNWTKVDIV